MSPFRPSMSVLSSSNQMAPWRVTLGFCLWVFFFLCNGSAQASFLETPSLEWSVTLPDNPTIGDNNVVQVWNNHILVTTAAGNLYMLDRRTGDSLGVFEASNNNGAVICKSGITIVSTLTTAEEASSDYAVYAVIDTTAATSQVIAVNIPDATLRWSMEVSGEITGTPVVGRSEDSRLIYVSHTTTTNENRSRGVLSVLQINDDHTQATIVANALSSPNPNVPALGPPTLQRLSTNPESIAATTTLNNGGDFVAVAENWNPNTGINLDNGAIYILGPSSNTFDPTNLGPESFEWRTVSDSVWSFGALAAPLFVDNSIYMGGTAAIIAGWTDNRDISSVLVQDGNNEDDVPPRWILQLNRNNNNADLRKSSQLVDARCCCCCCHVSHITLPS